MTYKEAIVEIRDIRVTLDDEWGIEESEDTCLRMAIEALEKAEKYRWHDLRKNPNDLPTKDGTYWVHGKWSIGKTREGECDYKAHNGYFIIAQNFNVIAWKEVEPFYG